MSETSGVGHGDAPAAATRAVAHSSEYEVRLPARFYKDSSISLEAKALLGIIVAHSDSVSRETYVGNRALTSLMRRGRAVIERTMNELCDRGWLRRKPQRFENGRWGPRYLVWQIPHADRSSLSPQRLGPAKVKRATSHIPSYVRSPKVEASSASELTTARKMSNGEVEMMEVLT